MEEVRGLVLLDRVLVLGQGAARRELRHREALRIEILPVVRADAARREDLEVRAERDARVRDRLVPRLACPDASQQRRDGRDVIVGLRAANVNEWRRHAATSTFRPQSRRTPRSVPSIAIRSDVSSTDTSITETFGLMPTLSRYSRKPASCSNWSGMRSTGADVPGARLSRVRVGFGRTPGMS